MRFVGFPRGHPIFDDRIEHGSGNRIEQIVFRRLCNIFSVAVMKSFFKITFELFSTELHTPISLNLIKKSTAPLKIVSLFRGSVYLSTVRGCRKAKHSGTVPLTILRLPASELSLLRRSTCRRCGTKRFRSREKAA